jgi:lipopolysaccharide transport protein LptA
LILAFLLVFGAPKDSRQEVTFQADNCSYGRAMAEAVCTGRVRVDRGDARLRCRSLTVRFDEAGRVHQLVCEGAVKFRRGDAEEASGSTALYTRDDARVVLEGDAKLRRGRARLSGDRVIFMLDEDQVRVEGQARGRFNNEER